MFVFCCGSSSSSTCHSARPSWIWPRRRPRCTRRSWLRWLTCFFLKRNYHPPLQTEVTHTRVFMSRRFRKSILNLLGADWSLKWGEAHRGHAGGEVLPWMIIAVWPVAGHRATGRDHHAGSTGTERPSRRSAQSGQGVEATGAAVTSCQRAPDSLTRRLTSSFRPFFSSLLFSFLSPPVTFSRHEWRDQQLLRQARGTCCTDTGNLMTLIEKSRITCLSSARLTLLFILTTICLVWMTWLITSASSPFTACSLQLLSKQYSLKNPKITRPPCFSRLSLSH